VAEPMALMVSKCSPLACASAESAIGENDFLSPSLNRMMYTSLADLPEFLRHPNSTQNVVGVQRGS
jgi:hypothetical protein